MQRGIRAAGVLFLVVATTATAGDFAPERRRDQFGKDFSYYVYPIGGDIPGLGSAFGLGATVLNMFDSDADFTGFKISGDFDASGYTLLDMHLLKRRLILDLGYYDFEVAPIAYQRGIDSDEDDYILPKARGAYWLGQLTATFSERRLEFFYRLGDGNSRLLEVRDRDGNAFEGVDTKKYHARFHTLGVTADYTDDRLDPRRGLRFEFAVRDNPAGGHLQSDYLTHASNLTGYVPQRRWDTLVFNLMVSGAHVTDQATTDYATLQAEMGLNCAQYSDPDEQQRCIDTETQFLNDRIAENRYGVAMPLGGTQRLRSFANGRFYAGKALAYGVEYRWNLTDEHTPFDIFIARGVRTGLQLAIFAERGNVAERYEDLFDDTRSSYGIGFRVVLSGVVIRADFARGEEGGEFILFINYPWSMFSVDNPG